MTDYVKRQILVDHDCVILDGSCDCAKPFEDCKHLKGPEKARTTLRQQADAQRRLDERTNPGTGADTGIPRINDGSHER